MKSIKKNYVLNLTYQILSVVLPLVTTPYITRVLGAEGIGMYSYSYSIVSYFVIVAVLGTATYGQREISFVRDNRERLSAAFWNIALLRFITASSCLCLYFLFLKLSGTLDSLNAVLSLNILTVVFDFVWFFQGLEEFGKITARDSIIKVLSVLSVFLFVKKSDDVVLYAFILTSAPLLSALSLIPFLKKRVSKVKREDVHPFRNIGAIVSLFIPTVAISVYAMLDKTMLGAMTVSKVENGYYEEALKISKTALTIVTALGTVMIPRISYCFGRGETERIREYQYKSYRFVWFTSLPLAFGLAAISHNLIPWFLGEDFLPAELLLSLLSFLIVIIGLSNVTGMQYLIPTKQQKYLTYSVTLGAVVNVILNSILIPGYYSIGAAIGSIVAEITVTSVQFFFVRKTISIKRIFLSSIKYLVSALVMFCVVYPLADMLEAGIVSTLILIVLGAAVYYFLLILLRDVFMKEAFSRVLSFLRKEKVE